jgi:coenzyme F420 hydrogenase subunit beta
MTEFGLYEPRRVPVSGVPVGADRGREPVSERAALQVCPFSGAGRNEDELSAQQFPDLPSHPLIGRWREIRAAHVALDDFRARGSSGGMTSWFLSELFRLDLIDAAIHVRPGGSEEAGPLFTYDVSRSMDQAVAWRKSRYHVVEMSQAINLVRSTSLRYAFVGLPCFVRSIRSLTDVDPRIEARLVTTIALVCGHLKSSRYAEYLAWTQGIPPGGLETMDFRHKQKGRPADRYAIRAEGRDRQGNRVQRERGVEHIRWSDWGIGLFKVPACDYCDDVVGETADVSFGDAWLPQFRPETEGKNLVITRSQLAERIVSDGVYRRAVDAVSLSPDEAARSQESGIRHRREGLAVRLAERQRAGRYTPQKRVAPDPNALGTAFGARMLAREIVAQQSHFHYAEARSAKNLSAFYRGMKGPIRRYRGSSPASRVSSVLEALEKRTPYAIVRLASRARSLVRPDR